MQHLFDRLCTANTNDLFLHNIKSQHDNGDPFDDLSDDPVDIEAANVLRNSVYPIDNSKRALIQHPFELASYTDAIKYPFNHWRKKRYSDGSFGVWLGADTLETSISETVFHWSRWLSSLSYSAAFARPGDPVIAERKVYNVHCTALLLDLRHKASDFPQLVDQSSYKFTQQVGTRLHYEGHPGLITRSARCNGDVISIFTPTVLFDPKAYYNLTYISELGDDRVAVERSTDETSVY